MVDDSFGIPRTINVSQDKEIQIFQELLTDVGGVVWDSALVAVHYFLKDPFRWKHKKVIELGAGTGICGIVLAAIGADVVLTDLPCRLALLKKNLEVNQHVLDGEVEVIPLDWLKDPLPPADVVLLVDCLYYLDSLSPLAQLLNTCSPSTEIVCIYEKRDIGEAAQAQKTFFDSIIPEYFTVVPVPTSDLDEYYCSSDIEVLRFVKRTS